MFNRISRAGRRLLGRDPLRGQRGRIAVEEAHADATYVRQAAAEAFLELDRLEGLWSVFRADSDVSRIACLAAGQSCVVDPDTIHCLRVALDIERATAGAFDIGYRTRPRRPASELIRLNERTSQVTALAPNVLLDLGGIGKGCALDLLVMLLADWDLPSALLRASKSTVLAQQAPPGQAGWPLRFGTAADSHTLMLVASAFSGSGSDRKGAHIVDPRTMQPAPHHRLAFATAQTGAEADALSTAFFVMTDEAIQDYCRHHSPCAAYVVAAEQASVQALHSPPRTATSLTSQSP